MQVELSDNEVQFIMAIFNKLSLNPLDPNTAGTAFLVQGIARKLTSSQQTVLPADNVV